MRFSFRSLFIAGFLFLTLFSSDLMAQEKTGWKVLGLSTVNKELDRGQITVKAKKGKFRQLKIQVKKAPVHMEKMIVHFNKDEKQVVWFKRSFEEGDWSRVIQVKGGKRVIDRVVLWGSKKDSANEESKVFLWGRQ